MPKYNVNCRKFWDQPTLTVEGNGERIEITLDSYRASGMPETNSWWFCVNDTPMEIRASVYESGTNLSKLLGKLAPNSHDFDKCFKDYFKSYEAKSIKEVIDNLNEKLTKNSAKGLSMFTAYKTKESQTETSQTSEPLESKSNIPRLTSRC